LRHLGYILLAYLTLHGVAMHAQHTPLTSQYLFNGLLINPAYAGSRDALAANITHRQQWVGFSGAPVTQIMSVHAPVNRRKVGLGLMLYNDRIGVSNETGIMTNYAYRLKFPNGKLAFGIGGGFTMLRGDWHTVAIQNPDDALFMEPTRSAFRPNFSAGVHYYSKKWFVGASAPFILLHRYNTSGEGFRITDVRSDLQTMLTAGYLVEFSSDIKLKPTILVRHRMEGLPQADLSMNVILRDKVWLGMSYRTQDAAIAMLEVLPTPQWRFGYAYDMGVSTMRNHHRGSHEILAQYEFGYRIRVRDPRYF
jgi:type IX secretion system PorP/SprF family membrane protein